MNDDLADHYSAASGAASARRSVLRRRADAAPLAERRSAERDVEGGLAGEAAHFRIHIANGAGQRVGSESGVGAKTADRFGRRPANAAVRMGQRPRGHGDDSFAVFPDGAQGTQGSDPRVGVTHVNRSQQVWYGGGGL